ncbi:hypothetical protein [Candidatus Venteria ishoeyi]|nr:hypothetical protein [Candidatus Venteria ishoeyi]SEH05414.1 Uncharacterised protein [Candidatus Venteria ishoeyi]
MILAIEKSLTETTEQDTTNELKAFLETLDPTKRKVDEEKLLQIEGKLYKSGREIKESLDAGEIQTKQIAGLVNRLKAQIIKYAN